MEAQFNQLVENLLDANRPDEAIEQSLKFLASNPEHVYARICLIRAHLMKEEPDKAEQASSALIKLAPELAFGYYLRSIACHQLNRFNSELEMAQQAAKLEPEDATMLQRLAEAQMQQGLKRKAQQTAEQLVKLEPDSEEAHELLGRIAYDLDDYNQAQIHLKEALRLDPSATHLLNNLALAYSAQKNYSDAIDILFNALKINPNDEALRWNTFHFIKQYLDQQTFKARRKKAFEALPFPIQAFYKDYKSRTNWLERYSNHAMTIVWIAVLAGISLLAALGSR